MHETACRYRHRFIFKQPEVAKALGQRDMYVIVEYRDDAYTVDEHVAGEDFLSPISLFSG